MKGFKETLNKMEEIMTAKNHDYSGETDPFKNFKMVEHLGISSVEQGLLVRMTDKMSRVSNLLGKECKVLDEKVEDTLLDLANYAVILKCYMESKK
jgi:hypothetical protein